MDPIRDWSKRLGFVVTGFLIKVVGNFKIITLIVWKLSEIVTWKLPRRVDVSLSIDPELSFRRRNRLAFRQTTRTPLRLLSWMKKLIKQNRVIFFWYFYKYGHRDPVRDRLSVQPGYAYGGFYCDLSCNVIRTKSQYRPRDRKETMTGRPQNLLYRIPSKQTKKYKTINKFWHIFFKLLVPIL